MVRARRWDESSWGQEVDGDEYESEGNPMSPQTTVDKDPAVTFLHEEQPAAEKDMSRWTVEEFLTDHGAQQAISMFKENGFDTVEKLVRGRLDDGQLKRLGLTSLKLRKFVSNALQKLAAEADAAREAAAQAEEAQLMQRAQEHYLLTQQQQQQQQQQQPPPPQQQQQLSQQRVQEQNQQQGHSPNRHARVHAHANTGNDMANARKMAAARTLAEPTRPREYGNDMANARKRAPPPTSSNSAANSAAEAMTNARNEAPPNPVLRGPGEALSFPPMQQQKPIPLPGEPVNLRHAWVGFASLGCAGCLNMRKY